MNNYNVNIRQLFISQVKNFILPYMAFTDCCLNNKTLAEKNFNQKAL